MFSFSQHLLLPGYQSLREGEREEERPGRRFRRRSTGSLDSEESSEGRGEDKMLNWPNSDKSRSSCSLSSKSDSSRSSSFSISSSCVSDCESDIDGFEGGFHPGMLGLEKEQGVISFQLEDEDYPEEVLRVEERDGVETSKIELSEKENSHHELSPVIPLIPPPPHSSIVSQYTTSLRLSPLLRGRTSSLPYV